MSTSNNEKTIYFVRHGQSEGNITPVFQPIDSPLTEKGREQARAIAKRVARLSFDKLIASPLPRSKETAEEITKVTSILPEYSDFFIERVKPSELAGKAYNDETANKLWKEWERSLYTPGIRARDGENFDDLIIRADKALMFLRNRQEKSLVVVTHGFFLRTIIARALLGPTLTGTVFKAFQLRMEMENTGLSVLKYKERYEGISWYLWVYNDHAHLG